MTGAAPPPAPGLEPGPEPDRFEILYVCTGNVCRSVLAERITRRGLADRLGDHADRFHTGSAGTQAVPGRPMHPYIRKVLRAREVEVEGFTSRRLSAGLVARADLVLGATAVERDEAIALEPSSLRRTFTLRELARLLDHATIMSRSEDPPGGSSDLLMIAGAEGAADRVARARRVVAAAHGMRGRVPYADPAGDDVADPEPTLLAFDQCATGLAGAVGAVLDALCGGPVGAEPGRWPVA